ncbi:MAG TPA: prepilin-type N-terminal cleavage/methylation domain-containing protein, partial [Pseudobacillus sp.]
MNLSKLVSQSQKGVTLLELLLAMTILSIVLLTFTRFFYQAGTYNLSNQNKTVALNVARNAMMFLEKENFIEMRNNFYEDTTPVIPTDNQLGLYLCKNPDDQIKGYTLHLSELPAEKPPKSPAGCRPVTINGGDYYVTISAGTTPAEVDNAQFYNYYIPVKVKVSWYQNENKKETELEGT